MATLTTRKRHNQLAEPKRCSYTVKDELTGKREKCNAVATITINGSHVPVHRCIGHAGTVKASRERAAKRNDYVLTLLKQFGL